MLTGKKSSGEVKVLEMAYNLALLNTAIKFRLKKAVDA